MTTTARNTIENLINNRMIILKAKLAEPTSMHSTQDRKEWATELEELRATALEVAIAIWE